MMTYGFLKHWRIRTNFLVGLGAHLGVNGLVLLALYYLVTSLSPAQAKDLLGWIIPAAQGCCFFAALSLAARLVRRENEIIAGNIAAVHGLFRKLFPWGSVLPKVKRDDWRQRRKVNNVELERTLSLLKNLDWKVFRDLTLAYFSELGFRAVDQFDRSSGVDFLLYTQDDYTAIAVRCMPWGIESVDEKQIRNCHRAMLLAGATQGVVVTTGCFDDGALAYGRENLLELVGGEAFAARLLALPAEGSRRLLDQAAGAECIRNRCKRW